MALIKKLVLIAKNIDSTKTECAPLSTHDLAVDISGTIRSLMGAERALGGIHF